MTFRHCEICQGEHPDIRCVTWMPTGKSVGLGCLTEEERENNGLFRNLPTLEDVFNKMYFDEYPRHIYINK